LNPFSTVYCASRYSSDQIETINGSIRYEIEMNVKSMNSKERLIAYMQQLHDAYDEKLQKSNNKIQSEMQEVNRVRTPIDLRFVNFKLISVADETRLDNGKRNPKEPVENVRN
jgi:hypothetical protein